MRRKKRGNEESKRVKEKGQERAKEIDMMRRIKRGNEDREDKKEGTFTSIIFE